MTTPGIGPQDLARLAAQLGPQQPAAPQAVPGDTGFKNTLLETLNEVNRLQMESAQGMEQLATGDTQNVSEVLSAVRKADVAFSLLMEMRNKLVEAYRELQQMRV